MAEGVKEALYSRAVLSFLTVGLGSPFVGGSEDNKRAIALA